MFALVVFVVVLIGLSPCYGFGFGVQASCVQDCRVHMLDNSKENRSVKKETARVRLWFCRNLIPYLQVSRNVQDLSGNVYVPSPLSPLFPALNLQTHVPRSAC